jgi:VIT1/CCC1 family predicted Fe2+/Mn2+ transporter
LLDLLRDPAYYLAGSMPSLRRISFGATSATVTSMGLIVGLGAVAAEKATILSGLLIVALADNLTDSLSLHVYQEAERLNGRAAFRATLTNFGARVLTALTFVVIVLVLPSPYAGTIALGWGVLLLATVSYLVARARAVRPWPEVGKHLGIAALVIGASRVLGAWIAQHVR